MLLDDVLLEIFDFYVVHVDDDPDNYHGKGTIEAWITLAHVCRRWRSVVFQSSHRLSLRLDCTPNASVRDTLDIWPPLPLIIRDRFGFYVEPPVDNIIAAPEHNDRVCQIKLTYSKSYSAAMQKPFPELTVLQLRASDRPGSKLPDSFLGGTAPRLRSLRLDLVPFPGLGKLLFSATHLVNLVLFILPSWYTPEVMATNLSALTSLKSFCLYFTCLRPRTARRPHLPQLTRSILPSLTKIIFQGPSEYLEVILARIDAPRLNYLKTTAFFSHIIFDTPQFFRFINQRSTPEAGCIAFLFQKITFEFRSQTSDCDVLSVRRQCVVSEWQLESLEQVRTSSLLPVSTLEDLYIFEDRSYPLRSQDDIINTQWLDLLRSFVALKNLYISEKFAPHIALAMQGLAGGRMTEVLPTLEDIFLEGYQPPGPFHEGIEKFVAARRLTSHPVAVSRYDGGSKQILHEWII